jgi:hypothetical protein
MIESSERMMGEQNNPATNKELELEIKTLQNAPIRHADRLEGLLKSKQEREKRQITEDISKTQRLVVTEEIEML